MAEPISIVIKGGEQVAIVMDALRKRGFHVSKPAASLSKLLSAVGAMKEHHCKRLSGEMHTQGACPICDVIYAALEAERQGKGEK